MSNRYKEDFDRRGSYGSSGSRQRTRSRSRSRSPNRSQQSYSKHEDEKYSKSSSRRLDRDRENSKKSKEKDVNCTPPPPPRISKIAIAFGKPGTVAKPGIQMKLNPAGKSEPKLTIASAFNDSDDEVEEMPPECRMRMRNIGRDTPTSSGPNSFGKTKQGFCDSKKIFEKSLKHAVDE